MRHFSAPVPGHARPRIRCSAMIFGMIFLYDLFNSFTRFRAAVVYYDDFGLMA
jgi:hypothetical protein